MKLLHIERHTTCLNYVSDYNICFIHQRLFSGGDFKIDNHHHSCILFLLKGEILTSCSEFHDQHIVEGHMVLFPQNDPNQSKSMTETEFILLFFDNQVNLHNKMSIAFILSLKRVVFIPYLSVLRYDMCWTVFASISNRKFSVVICMNWNRKRYSWYSVHSTIEQIWPTSWCPSQGEIRISKVSYWKTTCRYETSNSLHNYIIVPNVLSIVNSKAAFTILPTIGFLIKKHAILKGN